MSKWVKWDTELLTSPKWLSTPIDERGTFAWLLLLAAVSDPPGFLEATVDELATVLHVDAKVITRALSRLEDHGTLKRRKKGWVFVNFARFNPAARFLSHEQRTGQPRPTTLGHGGPRSATYTRDNDTKRDETIDAILVELYQAQGLLRDDGDAARVDRLLAEFTDRDLLREAKRAAAWTQTRPVKNFWLFYRNWLERSTPVSREMTADERRAQLRGVS